MKSRALKIAVSLLLSASLLCFSFSVYAVDPTPQPTGLPTDYIAEMDKQTMTYYIWLCMKAWGINLTYDESTEFQQAISDQIDNWVLDYIAEQPSIYSVATWIAPWSAALDMWGNYKFNNNLLDDVQDFVDWLVIKLGLIGGNTNTVIGDNYAINGIYPLYKANQWYDSILYDGTYVNPTDIGYQILDTNVSDVQYFYIYRTDLNDYVQVYIFNTTSFQAGWTNYVRFSMYTDIDEQIYVATQYFDPSFLSTSTYGVKYMGMQGNNCRIRPRIFDGPEMNSNQVLNFYSDMRLVAVDGMTVNTADLLLPADDPNYTNGDGMVVVDGTPQYGEVSFSGEITNLPAIISTGTLENPEIEQIYTNIPPLVEEASGSMEIMRQIIFRMPDEVLIALYALLSVGVIFGFLRIMREH